jgi:hypothetical protein
MLDSSSRFNSLATTAEPFQANWHLDAICNHLEAVVSRSRRAAIIARTRSGSGMLRTTRMSY